MTTKNILEINVISIYTKRKLFEEHYYDKQKI